MIGWACRTLFVWLVIFGVIAVVASQHGLLTREPGSATSSAAALQTAAAPTAAASQPAATANSLTFHAERNGYVYLDVAVNGIPVRMVVDTGATSVALTKEDAARIGIAGGLNFSMPMNTANGRGWAAPVRLREMRIGQLEIDNVDAVVQEKGKLFVSLLGQTFLRRLDSYEMHNGVLTLSW